VRRLALACAAALLLASSLLAAAAFARTHGKTPPRLTVFAAASLTDVFPKIARESYSFEGSNALATQIEQGLPADVFASANTTLPEQLYKQGYVTKPVDFTANRLVIVVGHGNPLGIKGPASLEAIKGVKIVMAAAGVPVGDYTRTVLARLHMSNLVDRAVSQETDVREVLSKVVLGEADAGFVYATDAKSVAGQVSVVRISPHAQPRVVYAAAAVRTSSHLAAAKAWVRSLLSRRAQKKLRAYGFLPLPR